jgi:hypothetical protein
MIGFTHRTSRKYTCHLLDMAEGVIDWETLARDALDWMSEEEVNQFARATATSSSTRKRMSKRFKFTLSRTAIIDEFYEIEADSEEEAMNIAYDGGLW